ncbi:MAG: MBL fold metallo-hydrolase [Rhodobacteraceae bacterium]|nr:MBL fold metallo-hydrolase [Paracoccaceae bacterium]
MAAEELEPGLRVILAPNPSPMTFRGTMTYLLGKRDLVVIDPGPMDQAHLSAILAAVGPGQRITRILVTHSHLDHSPLARPLAEATGAPVCAAGNSRWGQSGIMRQLATEGALGGGEGVDEGFQPDQTLREGDRIEADGQPVLVLETPGHMANHLSFAWNGALFSGDLVMSWSSSLISPPDGDMRAFYATLARLGARSDRICYPGHGGPVRTPRARCVELVAHRRAREAAILEALGEGAADTAQLARRIYTDTPAALLPAAERNILAHLIDLTGRNITSPLGKLTAHARFKRK